MGTRGPLSTAAGFTLVELVAIIVIMGILPVVAAPRFMHLDAFEELGYFEEAIAATRYAQKLAVATGGDIRMRFCDASDSFDISEWTGPVPCPTAITAAQLVARPGHDEAFQSDAPGSVNVKNDLQFFFDRVGRPKASSGALITDPADLTIEIGSREIQIVPNTGLVVAN